MIRLKMLRGFSLVEMLVVILISSLLLLSAARLLPALQRAVLQQSLIMQVQQELWRLAFILGKQLQRAGYCVDDCGRQAVMISADRRCVIIWWQDSTGGRTNTASNGLVGYRWRGSSVEIGQDIRHCEGGSWEKITDPRQLKITDFQLQIQPRSGLPPLIHIALQARAIGSGKTLHLQHTVVGFNLAGFNNKE